MRALVDATDPGQIIDVLRECADQDEPVLVLGGGSNILAADEGFAGTVLRPALRGIEVLDMTQDSRLEVAVGAGEPWDDLVAAATGNGWSGLETLAGIPGWTGATPVQNVGAYGTEIAERVSAVDVLDRTTGGRAWWSPERCGFGYRDSVFKRQPSRYVVLGVRLWLRNSLRSQPVRYPELARVLEIDVGATAPLADVRAAVLALRRAKGMVLDPIDPDTRSAGSFFTNPILESAAILPAMAPRWALPDGRVKTSAAWLIEAAGFGRGYRIDPGARAAISGKHPLALTNTGAASAAELLALARAVRDGVRAAFGIILVPEPVLVGCRWD